MNTHFYYKSTHSITDDNTHCFVTTATTEFNISKCEATFYYKRKYIYKRYIRYFKYIKRAKLLRNALFCRRVYYSMCVCVCVVDTLA